MLIFSTPGTSDPEAGRGGPGCQNLAFQRFDPMILCSFLWRIRWTTLENHRTKQMMVYEQFTFSIKSNCLLFFLDRKADFWIKKKLEPELDRTRTSSNRNRTEPEPTETEPNQTEPWDSWCFAQVGKSISIENTKSSKCRNCILLACWRPPGRLGEPLRFHGLKKKSQLFLHFPTFS